MPLNELAFLVVDLETGGLFKDRNPILEVAGKAYNGRTLEAYPPSSGGEFSSLMKPLDESTVEDQALAKNGLTWEEIRKAPHPSVVWPRFCGWVNQYRKGKTDWGAPICVGKNVKFDLGFIEVANGQWAPKKEKQRLFHRTRVMELENLLFLWDEGVGEVGDYSMDTWREYLGVSSDGAHRALKDVRDTGLIFTHFLKLHRKLRGVKTHEGRPLIIFANSLRGPR